MGRNLQRRGLATRNYGAWLLCGLLLILCANARLASYDIHHRALRLATTQAYVDSTESVRKLPKTSTLLQWQMIATAAFVATILLTVRFTAYTPAVIPIDRFDPEYCSRPPPVR